MEERPSREDVDEAYGHAETLGEMVVDGSRTEESLLPSEMNLICLGAEVRALRGELEEMVDANLGGQLAALRDTLERVRALPATWRENGYVGCPEDLEEALKEP